MDIKEEQKEALEKSCGIRIKGLDNATYILPTSTEDGYIIVRRNEFGVSINTYFQWSPTVAEMLSNDWELTPDIKEMLPICKKRELIRQLPPQVARGEIGAKESIAIAICSIMSSLSFLLGIIAVICR